MKYNVNINGLDVEASYSKESINTIFLPLLSRLQKLQKEKGRRILVMLAAPCAAGKSTLCSFLSYLAKENNIDNLCVISMDGFHHYQDYLLNHYVERNGETIDMVKIKGAPITFDLTKLKQAIVDVAEGKKCYWPSYDRTLHNPVENAIVVDKDIVLLEGNYLLLKSQGWDELSKSADYTIFISAQLNQLKERLINRKAASNGNYQKAVEFVEYSDLVNAKEVLENSKEADLVLLLQDDDQYVIKS